MKLRFLSLFALFSALVVSASGATISISPAAVTPSAGDSFSLNVVAGAVTNLYAFQFDLRFDPAIVSVTSIVESGYFATNGIAFIPGVINNTSGSITGIADTLSGSSSGFSGASTTLASILFTAKAAGMSAITPANITLLDNSLNPITTTTTSGSVVVSGGPTPPTTPVPEPSTYAMVTGGLIMGVLIWKRRK